METINTITPFITKAMAYGDLTGSFPYTLSRGAKYLSIMYNNYANTILVHMLKSKQAHETKQAWIALTNSLSKHGHVLKHFVLNTEYTNNLKQAIRKHSMTFQLIPPHNHRQNVAKRVIKTCKAHFLSTLATCDTEYLITEWDMHMLIP